MTTYVIIGSAKIPITHRINVLTEMSIIFINGFTKMYTNSPYNGVHTDIRLSNSLKRMPITQFIYDGKKNSYWPIVSFLHIFCTVLSKNM